MSWTYRWCVRAALLLVIVFVTGCGCGAGPRRGSVAAAPVQASERWPSAEEAAAWPISRDEAVRIARDAQEDQDPRHMIYHSQPVVRAGTRFWRVTGTSMIAGGWEAEIDARSGAVLRSLRVPGR